MSLCTAVGLSTAAEEPVPALRLVTLADGSAVFLDASNQVVGWPTDEPAVPEAVSATPPQLPGWPFVGGEVEATPVAADLDGDGVLEAVFNSSDGGLNVLGPDGLARPGWPYPLGRTGHSPALADADGDGTYEIFMAGPSAVVALRYDGTVLPGWPVPGVIFSTAGVSDLDGDGEVEIAAMNDVGVAYLLDRFGGQKPGWPFVFPSIFAQSNKGPALGDVDGDGLLEIAFPIGFDPSLYLFRVDATIPPGFPLYLTPAGLKQGVSMADVNGDGVQEFVFQETTGFWIVDGTGQPLPGFPVPGGGGNSPPAVGDIDGDGHLEFAFGTIGGDAQVLVFRDDGTLQPGWPVIVPAFSFNAQATLGDVDGDGTADIVLGGLTTFNSQGRIYAWHADGTRVAGFPFDVPEGKGVGVSSVTITDLDQDGDVELLVGTITGFGGTSSGRAFAFDLDAPYDPATLEWPTQKHDIQRTARYAPPDARPVADAGPDQEVECASPAGALVTLDGSASSDPDAGDAVVSYEWFEDFGVATEVLLGTGVALEADLSLGVHAITLRVRDRPGAVATDTVTVAVGDTAPPVLEVVLSPAELWPPNHRLIDVTAAVVATDACGVPEVILEEVTSSEPDDAPGADDGATSGDVQDAEPGTADVSFRLRAERAGSGPGRTYTARYRATDGSGNAAAAQATAVVPHDRGPGGIEPLVLSLSPAGAGTRVTWAEVAGALFYAVVRGETGQLRDTGAAYDVGAVACLLASPAPRPEGAEDAAVPAPGAAFFYLAQDDDGAPSGYGTGSAARERIAGPGTGCP